MHGRWITRSGRKNFSDIDEIIQYFIPIFDESLNDVKQLYTYFSEEKIIGKILNSISIYKISDHLKLNGCFGETHVKRMKIIYKDVNAIGYEKESDDE
jgi:hypothetical protein